MHERLVFKSYYDSQLSWAQVEYYKKSKGCSSACDISSEIYPAEGSIPVQYFLLIPSFEKDFKAFLKNVIRLAEKFQMIDPSFPRKLRNKVKKGLSIKSKNSGNKYYKVRKVVSQKQNRTENLFSMASA